MNYANNGHNSSGQGQPQSRELQKLKAQINLLRRSLQSVRVKQRSGVKSLMDELGIEGDVLDDGRVQLANGRTVGEAIVVASSPSAAVSSSIGLADALLPHIPEDESSSRNLDAALHQDEQLNESGLRVVRVAGNNTTTYHQPFKGASTAAAANVSRIVGPLRLKIEALRRKNHTLKTQIAESDTKHASQLEKLYAELNTLREERDRVSTELKDAEINFQEKMKFAQNEFNNRVHEIAKNREAFELETMRPLRAATAQLGRFRADGSGRSLNFDSTEADAKIEDLRQELETTRQRLSKTEDALRNVKEQSEHWISKRQKDLRAWTDQLNNFYERKRLRVRSYKRELDLMGKLAEQLIVALHQGSVVDGRDTPDNEMIRDVARRCNRRDSKSQMYSGPIPLGLKGQDAASAAAAWLANAENLPKWHQIRRTQSNSRSTSIASSSDEREDSKHEDGNDDDDEEDVCDEDVYPLVTASRTQNAHHYAVLKDLRMQRQTARGKSGDGDDILKERLHESRQRYFDLRVAHDALLRKLRKLQSNSSSGGTSAIEKTMGIQSNTRRRFLLTKRRAKSGVM